MEAKEEKNETKKSKFEVTRNWICRKPGRADSVTNSRACACENVLVLFFLLSIWPFSILHRPKKPFSRCHRQHFSKVKMMEPTKQQEKKNWNRKRDRKFQWNPQKRRAKEKGQQNEVLHRKRIKFGSERQRQSYNLKLLIEWNKASEANAWENHSLTANWNGIEKRKTEIGEKGSN